jgi:hypothetical protein
MSRSNHNYFKICEGPVDDDGLCVFHGNRYFRPSRKCILAGNVVTRRGVFRRRKRFPKHSFKIWHKTPPRWLKQHWHRRARARQQEEFLKDPDDPTITPLHRLWDLWEWY